MPGNLQGLSLTLTPDDEGLDGTESYDNEKVRDSHHLKRHTTIPVFYLSVHFEKLASY
jgi:hypothetical protein